LTGCVRFFLPVFLLILHLIFTLRLDGECLGPQVTQYALLLADEPDVVHSEGGICHRDAWFRAECGRCVRFLLVLA
jgi:hypothetical protein